MLSWEYPPYIEGGLGRHVAELAPALAQQGVEVHVVTPAFDPTVQQPPVADAASRQPVPQATVSVENNVVVHRVTVPQAVSGNKNIYGRVTEVNRILGAYVGQISHKEKQWELIHIHDWLTGFAGTALRQTGTAPLIVTIHATERGRARGHLTNDLQRSIDSVEHGLVHQADRVIVCSRHMFNELQTFFEAPAFKLDIVPNGVDVATLQQNSHQSLDEFRAKYARPDEKIVFTVSRLVYEKGVHRLVEATPRILAECPAAKIIIAGRGPESRNLKQQAQSLGVADRINFIGFVSDEERNRLFQVADCAVFPSLYEPFGIVALEAMALGCPVVVSDVGGFSEVVTHKETGITTFADDPQSVAWGVLHTITHPIWARRHARKARQSVEELFNWTRIARLTKDVYQRALETREK